MPNLPISGLTASASNAAATDVLPVVQTTGTGPVKMTVQQMAGGLLGSTTLSGATITADAPVLNMSQTWNNGAVTFTGLKFNATDTASAAGSLLMDLQVGGVSRFSVRKDGVLFTPSQMVFSGGDGRISRQINYGGIRFESNNDINIGVGSNGGVLIQCLLGLQVGANDTILTRRGTANLRLGAADAAAPVAQTLSVQSVVAGTTNTAGADLIITASQGTGTANGGKIIFQNAPPGSSGTAQNALAATLTLESGGSVFGNSYANFAGRLSGVEFMVISGNNRQTALTGNGLTLSDGKYVGFTGSSTSTTSLDVFLFRDAANTLALRNGTAAQAFRVYNTFTDASNYARWQFVANSGPDLLIENDAAGSGGTSGNLIIGTNAGGSVYLKTNTSNRWQVNSSGHFLANADNTYDIGASGATRPRNVYIGGSIVVGDGGRISRQSAFGGIVFQSNNSVELGPGTGGTFATGANSAIRIVQPLTVATLPTPSTGMMARVTDALTPTMGTTVAGGGAAQALVWYNGANWTVIGV